MTPTVMEKTEEQLAETFDKASRKAVALGDAFKEQVEEVRIATKKGLHAAEEALDETRVQIKKHPVSAVGSAFLVGIGIGTFVGWLSKRK